MSKEKELVIYQTKSGSLELKEDFSNQTIWATQKDISKIYEKDQSVISMHIRNIFEDGEVDRKSNMQKMHISLSDKLVEFYSLDIILAIGCRVNSSKAIILRKWVTKTLKDHIVKGFIINKKKIKGDRDIFINTVDNMIGIVLLLLNLKTKNV